MIKRYRYLPILVIAFLGVFYFLRDKHIPQKGASDKKNSHSTQTKIDLEKREVNGKKVIGLQSGKEKDQLKNIRVANTPSPLWEPALEESLRLQGGKELKDIKLNKVDSFVWNHDGVALFVESVIVTIKNSKNEETIFRVLVDAQSGKILKNWDQPVIDPVNPRQGFRIKIDPRYHGI